MSLHNARARACAARIARTVGASVGFQAMGQGNADHDRLYLLAGNCQAQILELTADAVCCRCWRLWAWQGRRRWLGVDGQQPGLAQGFVRRVAVRGFSQGTQMALDSSTWVGQIADTVMREYGLDGLAIVFVEV
jgi:hypothetical protein